MSEQMIGPRIMTLAQQRAVLSALRKIARMPLSGFHAAEEVQRIAVKALDKAAARR